MNCHKLKFPAAGLLAAGACLLVVAASGCSMLEQTNQQLDEGAHAPGRARDMGIAVETDSNINQINMALSMSKSDNDGKPPATIDDAKKAAKSCPAVMWTDRETGKPLVYDPVTGTVHRDGAAADSPPAAGSSNAPGGLKGPNGGAGAGGY